MQDGETAHRDADDMRLVDHQARRARRGCRRGRDPANSAPDLRARPRAGSRGHCRRRSGSAARNSASGLRSRDSRRRIRGRRRSASPTRSPRNKGGRRHRSSAVASPSPCLKQCGHPRGVPGLAASGAGQRQLARFLSVRASGPGLCRTRRRRSGPGSPDLAPDLIPGPALRHAQPMRNCPSPAQAWSADRANLAGNRGDASASARSR